MKPNAASCWHFVGHHTEIQSNAITRLYFSAGWHGFDQISADDEKLRGLIRDVHAAGIEIYSLQGDAHWANAFGRKRRFIA